MTQRRETRDERQVGSGKQQSSGAQNGYGYRDLVVWQKGMELAKRIYRVTQSFPTEEKFGLVSQMRRSAVSVPSNIAEGQARHTTKEFIQFVSHAEGSVCGVGYSTPVGHRSRLLSQRGHCGNHGTNRGDTEDVERAPSKPIGEDTLRRASCLSSLVSRLSL